MTCGGWLACREHTQKSHGERGRQQKWWSPSWGWEEGRRKGRDRGSDTEEEEVGVRKKRLEQDGRGRKR